MKFKKLIAAVCGLAIAATATMMPLISASADGVGYSLTQGTANATASRTFITLTVDGVSSSANITSGTVIYKVTKGVFSSAQNRNLNGNGLNAGSYQEEDDDTGELVTRWYLPSFEISFNATNAEYDILTISWAVKDNKTYTTSTGNITGVRLDYANGQAAATFEPITTDSTVININGSNTSYNSSSQTTSYSLPAGSNAPTAVSGGGDDPVVSWVDATQVGGLYEADSYVEDQSKAVAWVVSLPDPAKAQDAMTWQAKFGAATKGMVKNFAGSISGATKFGVIIKGVTASDDVTEVKAAWGDQTPSAE